MKQQLQNLTEQERKFAAEHHCLIYQYLNTNNLTEEEYYDIVVFGYLEGVQKYFRQDAVNVRPFYELVYERMSKACIECDNSQSNVQFVSIQEPFYGSYALEEVISDAHDYAEETLEAMRVKETMQSFEQEERTVTRLLTEDYTKEEICKMLRITAEELTHTISNIQTKIKNSPLMQVV